jgi:YVTN family beta-propeller protein
MRTALYFLLLSIVCMSASAHAAKTLYVVNGLSETLSKIDLESEVVTNDIVALGTWPNDILVSGERAYVVNSGSNDLTIIDLTSESILSVIDLGAGTNPWSLAAVGENTLYVTNFQANSVSKVDLESRQVTASITVGPGPEGIIRDGRRLYVANTGWTGSGFEAGSVSVIDWRYDSVIATLPVGVNAQDLAMDPQGDLDVVCTGDFASTTGMLYRIASASLVVRDSIATGGTPARAAITDFGLLYMAAGGWADQGEVYVHNSLRDRLLHDSSNPIVTPPGATDVTTDSEGYVYVASFAANSVAVFDVPDDPVRDFEVGSGPTALALREDPWVEVSSVPESRVARRGETLTWNTTLRNTGESTESVEAATLLVLESGKPFPGNPLEGPFTLTLSPGRVRSASFSAVVPDSVPMGRYVLISLAQDLDSRKQAVGSFWFHVLP